MSENPPAGRPARRTILLVDDDARIRQTLTLLLRWSGDWEVVGEAADGGVALDLATARRPDLVLLDRWLADGDGLGVIPRLRALVPPPLVVMLTADNDVAIQRQALALGAAGWLEKTTSPLDLLQLLRGFVAAG
jgi:DNA-binding NarL/FixJ family response regulator